MRILYYIMYFIIGIGGFNNASNSPCAVHAPLMTIILLSGQLLQLLVLREYYLALPFQECVLINNLWWKWPARVVTNRKRARDATRTNNKWREMVPLLELRLLCIVIWYSCQGGLQRVESRRTAKKLNPLDLAHTIYLFVLNNWSPRSRQEPRRTKNAVECVTVARALQGD